MSDSVNPWTAVHQVFLSITNSWSLLKLMSIELVMPSNHLILCCPLLLLPSIFPRIRVFSNESALRIRWPKYCSFNFNISPSKEHPGLISFRMDNPIQHTKKQIHHFVNKFLYSQNYVFSSSHVWMWELNYKENWAPKNWCFWTVVLEKTLESLLDCKDEMVGWHHWLYGHEFE